MLAAKFSRSAVAIALTMLLSACARNEAPLSTALSPQAIISLSAQTIAVVHHLGASDLMLTPAGSTRESLAAIDVLVRDWLRQHADGRVLIIGLRHDAPDISNALAEDSRVRLALYSACDIIETFAMYEAIGELLGKTDIAAAHIRQTARALAEISGSTLGLPRPGAIVLARGPTARALTGTGLPGDMIESGGGEHLLELAGPACSSVALEPWNWAAPQIVLDTRNQTAAPDLTPPGRVVEVPDLMRKLADLELVEAAREVRAALFPEIAEFQVVE